MKLTPAFFGLALLASISGPAFAAATPEEAQRLTEVFQAYLGKEQGVVTVTPDGDSYRARFDATPLFAKIKEPGVSVSLTPIEWVITPQGGGKWQVDQNQPLAFEMKSGADAAMKVEAGLVKGTGVFDEALGGFSSSSSQISRLSLDQTFVEQGQNQQTKLAIDTMTFMSAMSGTGDLADVTYDTSFTGMRQAVSVPASSSAPAVEIVTSSPDGTQTVAIKGLRLKPMTSLMAWLVAHPADDEIAAGQAELKEKLRAALPLFTSLSSTSNLNGLSIEASGSKVGMQQLSLGMDSSGVVADGYLRARYAASGIQVPAGLVPPWAASLLPENAAVDLKAGGLDLAAAAALMIDKTDLAKDPPQPAGFEDEFLKALMPTGAMQLGLGPSEILSKAFRLNAEGSMTTGPAVMPAGKATVKLAGMDQLMAALQAAPPEMEMQGMAPMLLLIRGLAKQEADGALSWAIESTPTGSVTVNGTDLTKMMGGQ